LSSLFIKQTCALFSSTDEVHVYLPDVLLQISVKKLNVHTMIQQVLNPFVIDKRIRIFNSDPHLCYSPVNDPLCTRHLFL
jgi:hypothetical protein